MRLYRNTPCEECPWRRSAPAGWLGGHSVADYAQLARHQIPTACHKTVREDGVGQPAMCTGWAQLLNNSCSTPRDRDLAAEVAKAGANPDVFRFTSEFEDHHQPAQDAMTRRKST